jgi:DNA-binding MarR family transcriptional regulator
MSSALFLDPVTQARDHANRNLQRALFRLHGRLNRTRNARLWELELTSAQLRVVDAIRERPGWGLSELARYLDLSRQAVHRLVHVLAGKGYLKLPPRRRGDRRRLVPQLDTDSALCIEGAIEGQCEFWRDLTAAFPPRDLQFTAMEIDRIWRHLSQRPVYGPGCEAP